MSQERRRILLVNPRITSRRSARMPLTLLALAAALGERYECRLIDGNMDGAYLDTLRRQLSQERFEAVGVTVMGGPQVRTAIETSLTVRQAFPATPVIWGGYFPTLYTDTTLRASYVDYAVRGQGEITLPQLLDVRAAAGDPGQVAGLSWKRDGIAVHNPDRSLADGRPPGQLPYELLPAPRSHQAALGCRFRCTFCGVAGMFRGGTALPPATRLERDLAFLRDGLGADSVQYFDHNFFDREEDMLPLLEVMARMQLPWWCYARADALLNLSPQAWALVRASRLRMAYIGAETASDALLANIRKGTRVSQTLEVARLCREQGVIPELSFMVAPPQDPEGVRAHSSSSGKSSGSTRPQRSWSISIPRCHRRACQPAPACGPQQSPSATLRAAKGSLPHHATLGFRLAARPLPEQDSHLRDPKRGFRYVAL